MVKFRVARPTNNPSEIIRFYCDGLGLEVIASFENHKGFDGVMLGHKGSPYHLEFTHHCGHKVGKAPTQDNLLVFYIPDGAQWKNAVERMRRHGYEPVTYTNLRAHETRNKLVGLVGHDIKMQNASWDL